MTAINLPGQTELPIVVDHSKQRSEIDQALLDAWSNKKPYPEWPIDGTTRGKIEDMIGKDHPALQKADPRILVGVSLAKLLRDYDNRPSSETWSKIQKLSLEILG